MLRKGDVLGGGDDGDPGPASARMRSSGADLGGRRGEDALPAGDALVAAVREGAAPPRRGADDEAVDPSTPAARARARRAGRGRASGARRRPRRTRRGTGPRPPGPPRSSTGRCAGGSLPRAAARRVRGRTDGDDAREQAAPAHMEGQAPAARGARTIESGTRGGEQRASAARLVLQRPSRAACARARRGAPRGCTRVTVAPAGATPWLHRPGQRQGVAELRPVLHRARPLVLGPDAAVQRVRRGRRSHRRRASRRRPRTARALPSSIRDRCRLTVAQPLRSCALRARASSVARVRATDRRRRRAGGSRSTRPSSGPGRSRARCRSLPSIARSDEAMRLSPLALEHAAEARELLEILDGRQLRPAPGLPR